VTVFVDTSAFFAVIDSDDDNHAAGAQTWKLLLESGVSLVTSSYVLVETAALLQNRLGMPAVRLFQQDIVPLLSVEWINADQHHAGMEAVIAASRKKLSLVDCVSFQIMRRLGIRGAFCFDGHFPEQGFITKFPAGYLN